MESSGYIQSYGNGPSNLTASGMAAEAPASGTLTHEAEALGREVSALHDTLNRIEARLQFPPRPEGVEAKRPEDSRSGLASNLQDSRRIAAAANDRLKRIADAI